jgi:hypothetical protein
MGEVLSTVETASTLGEIGMSTVETVIALIGEVLSTVGTASTLGEIGMSTVETVIAYIGKVLSTVGTASTLFLELFGVIVVGFGSFGEMSELGISLS